MENSSPGQIYLADERGIIETDIYRRCCSFNYESYFNEHRKPFGPLKALNDEILAAQKSVTIVIAHACYFVIIPVRGELLFKDTQDNTTLIDVGEAHIHYTAKGDILELINPYHKNWINFLYLQIIADSEEFSSFRETFRFDFAERPNELIGIIPPECKLPFNLHIGQFSGRKDTLYQLKNLHSLFFAFNITGAFELQGRLMHERDGLALWNLAEADLEALSNNAVMLILEMTD
jgi:hypothetical protein